MDAQQKLEAIKLALAKVKAEEASLLSDVAPTPTMPEGRARTYLRVGAGLGSLAGSLALGYHGYKRNHDSAAWGLGWWFLGGAFPIGTAIGAILALDQGFARPLPEPVLASVANPPLLPDDLSRSCPRCKAAPGKPCRSSTGASVRTCKARKTGR